MKKLVIIGASGYVGSALLQEALRRGYEVKAIVRHPEKITVKDQKLQIVQGDISSEEAVSQFVKGADAVISAYNPGWQNPDIYEETLRNYPFIINGCKKAGIKRLQIVGGAGSLFIAPGLRLMDSGEVPEKLLPGIKALAEVLFRFLLPEKSIDWVFLSPSASLEPGQRTGKYRTGKDDLLTNEKGESKISVEDYAVAMLDELDHPRHHQERFTVGY